MKFLIKRHRYLFRFKVWCYILLAVIKYIYLIKIKKLDENDESFIYEIVDKNKQYNIYQIQSFHQLDQNNVSSVLIKEIHSTCSDQMGVEGIEIVYKDISYSKKLIKKYR